MIKKINTGTTELLCILIPKDKGHIIEQYPGGYFFLHYGSPKMDHSGTVYLAYKDLGSTHYLLKAGIQSDFPYNFDSLGIAHGLAEETWELILPNNPDYSLRKLTWVCYTKDNGIYLTATESGLSLLIANSVFSENPYGINEPELDAVCCGNWIQGTYCTPQCCGNPIPSEESSCLQHLWQKSQETTGRWVMLRRLI